jgi:hypothetical protein
MNTFDGFPPEILLEEDMPSHNNNNFLTSISESNSGYSEDKTKVCCRYANMHTIVCDLIIFPKMTESIDSTFPDVEFSAHDLPTLSFTQVDLIHPAELFSRDAERTDVRKRFKHKNGN